MSKYIKVGDMLKRGLHISDIVCDKCGRQLREYEGKHGAFLGCPKWQESDDKPGEGCKATKSIYGSAEKKNRFLYHGGVVELDD